MAQLPSLYLEYRKAYESTGKGDYQKWLSLKDTDKSTANAVYIEYLELKCKIDDIEIPF